MVKRLLVAVVIIVVLWAVHWTAMMAAIVSTVPCWDFEFDRPHAPISCPWYSEVGGAVATFLNLPLGAILWGWLIDRVPGLSLEKIGAMNSLIWALAIFAVLQLTVLIRSRRRARIAAGKSLD